MDLEEINNQKLAQQQDMQVEQDSMSSEDIEDSYNQENKQQGEVQKQPEKSTQQFSDNNIQNESIQPKTSNTQKSIYKTEGQNNQEQSNSQTQQTQQQTKQQQQQQQSERQKENMQQTIKSLQERSQHIEKMLEKGNDVIVFQYSSDTIKFGFADQKFPQKVKNQVAYKLKKPFKNEKDSFHQKRDYMDNPEALDMVYQNVEYHLISKGNVKQEQKMQKGKPKAKVEHDFKKQIHYRVDQDGNKIQNPEVVFDEEVFLYDGNQNWAIKRPIKHGFFNLNKGKESIRSVVSDLENITRFILSDRLNLKQSEFKNYSIILVIPDIYIREQISALVDMFLRNLQFRQLYIHLESVLATYGACLSSACVVDIGYQKINVCCVEEGVILPNTLIRKNFGGEDIDNILYRLLMMRHSALFKKKGHKLDYNYYGDINSLSRVKEKICSMIQSEDHSNRIYDSSAYRNGNEEVYNVFHNESVYLAPQSLFYKDVFNDMVKFGTNSDIKPFDFTSPQFDDYQDPSDYLEDFNGPKTLDKPINYFQVLIQASEAEKKEEEKKENQEKPADQAENQMETEQQQQEEKDKIEEEQVTTKKGRRSRKKKDDAAGKAALTKQQQIQNEQFLKQQEQIFAPKQKVDPVQMIKPFQMEDLDVMIAHSIGECKDPDTKVKMANTVLIVGGTTQVSKFVEELEDRLINTVPVYCPDIERVEVIDPLVTREVLSSFVSWNGATVIPRLESTKDLWITRGRWLGESRDEFEFEIDENDKQIQTKKEKSNEFGIRVLKEKVPFQW